MQGKVITKSQNLMADELYSSKKKIKSMDKRHDKMHMSIKTESEEREESKTVGGWFFYCVATAALEEGSAASAYPLLD